LVVIDKIPFKPGNDPLAKARKEYADKNGRNGFMEVFVAVANIMLAQGAGRLIRSLTDRGVVAILDTRLRTKAYGPVMMRSLPPMGVFSDLKQVCDALKRLTSS
jgi:ATP-dependent DNA helicase DinG